MPLPTVTEQNIKDLLPDVISAVLVGRGGQKIVFRIELSGQVRIPAEVDQHSWLKPITIPV